MKKNILILTTIISLFIFLFSMSLYSDTIKGKEGVVVGKLIEIDSKVLKRTVPVLLSLPSGYEKGFTKYPVLYKFNGNLNKTFTFTASSLELLAANNNIPGFILVDIAMGDQNKYFQLQNRDRDFRNEPELFGRFITDELIKYIDNNFRTVPYKILYGQSNAGMFTLYMMLNKGEKFSAFIASSPMIGWTPDYFYKAAKNQLASIRLKDKHLVIVYGEKDLKQVTGSLPGFITILRINRELTLDQIEITECAHVPYTGFYRGLLSVFRGWKYSGELTDSGEFKKIKTHYSKLKKKFGFEVNPPQYFLFKLGFNLYRETMLWRSAEVFRYLLDLYPESFRARYFLARIYYLTKKKKEAIEQLKILLGSKPGYKQAESLLNKLISE